MMRISPGLDVADLLGLDQVEGAGLRGDNVAIEGWLRRRPRIERAEAVRDRGPAIRRSSVVKTRL
jgi:hypothetical protein